MPYSPLGRGFLTGATIDPDTLADDDWRRHDERFSGDNLTSNRALVATLAALADELGATPAQLALAWLLAQGDDVVPVAGMTRPERVDQNRPATEIDLTADDLARIEDAIPRQAWAGSTSSFRSSTARPAGDVDRVRCSLDVQRARNSEGLSVENGGGASRRGGDRR